MGGAGLRGGLHGGHGDRLSGALLRRLRLPQGQLLLAGRHHLHVRLVALVAAHQQRPGGVVLQACVGKGRPS